MRRVLIPVGVVVVALGLVIVWWLRRPDEQRAKHARTASGTAAQTSRASGPRAPAKPATVSGRVTRKSDGAGVAGAVVSLARAEFGADLGSSDAPSLVATTDASGAWTAPQVAPGDYVIAAAARGLLPAARARLTVASGEQRSGIDFVLDAGGTVVRGTVTDVGGGPIASARVRAKRENWTLAREAEFIALTGADGTYELSLPDGGFRLNASHDDYTADGEGIEVAGKPLTVDFTLIPGGVIRGQVIARDTGKPVPGAMVKAEVGRRSMRDRNATAIADGAGQFTLRGLTSGAASIEARGRGYASASPTIVQLGIGEQVEGIQVLLDGAFSISGRIVKKGTKDGIAGARIGVFTMTGQEGEALDPSDADGYFEIAGIKPGSYMVFAGAEGMMLEIGKPVEVVDHDVKDVIVELSGGVTISGRVEPPGVATVMLELEGEIGIANMFEMIKAAMARTESDAAGAFTMKNAPPGKFKLAAMTKQGKVGKLPITIANVDQSGLVIQLAQRASIAGRVIDTNGKPVAGMTVVAEPDDDKPRGMTMLSMGDDTTSGPDGSFKIVGLDAGTYEVRARTMDDFTTWIPDKDRKKVIVELADGAERKDVTLTVEARDGVIRGQVIGPDNKPAADAWVTASREREKLAGVKLPGGDDDDDMPGGFSWLGQSEPVLTNDQGKFVINKLRKGKYTIVAEGPRGSSRGEKNGVKTGESTTIQLASLGTLIVTVTHGGAPVKSYDLSCEGPAGDVDRHSSSADGTYKLDHLAPSDYKCHVRADTGTAKGKVTVPAGEAKLALALAPWGSITGNVVSVLNGKPVPDLGVIATSDADQSGFMEAMAGRSVKTDANGRFVLERVAAGKGRVMLIAKDQGMGHMETHEYTAKEGQRVDIGTIKVVPPRTGEAGTFGMGLEVDQDGLLKVTSVKEGGPAAGAGVRVGDRISAIEGQPIIKLGIDTALKVLSSGNVDVGVTLKVTLERGPTVALTAIKW